jgi:hypothetical protein
MVPIVAPQRYSYTCYIYSTQLELTMTEAIATEAAVHRALDDIDQRGEKATQRRVIELLGGGSFSSVTKHIQTWRPKDRPPTNLGPVPEQVSIQVSQMVEHLWALSAVAAEKRANERAAELDAKLRRSEADREELATLLDEVIAERDMLKTAAAERDELKAQYASLRAERDTLDRMVQKLSGVPTEQRRPKTKTPSPAVPEQDASPSA